MCVWFSCDGIKIFVLSLELAIIRVIVFHKTHLVFNTLMQRFILKIVRQNQLLATSVYSNLQFTHNVLAFANVVSNICLR